MPSDQTPNETAYREIRLCSRNGSVIAVAIVDADRYEEVAVFRWSLHRRGHYAYRMITRDGRQELVLMHRMLLGLKPGDGWECDHINRDGLDNRMRNLRVCTHAFNMQNKGASRTYGGRPVTSKFVCVSWNPRKARWRAQTTLWGVSYRLGNFRTELEAALAVELWRQKYKPWSMPDPELVRAKSPKKRLPATDEP